MFVMRTMTKIASIEKKEKRTNEFEVSSLKAQKFKKSSTKQKNPIFFQKKIDLTRFALQTNK